MRKKFRQRQLTREDQEDSNKTWKELVLSEAKEEEERGKKMKGRREQQNMRKRFRQRFKRERKKRRE